MAYLYDLRSVNNERRNMGIITMEKTIKGEK